MKKFFNIKKLRNNIFAYFCIVTVLLVFFIWLLQTVFFNANFQSTRENAMNEYAEILVDGFYQNGKIDSNTVLSLHESGISTVLIKKSTSNAVTFVYPQSVSEGEWDKYQLFFTSIMEKMDVKGLERSSGDLVVENLKPMLYSAVKIQNGGQEFYLILSSEINFYSDTVKALQMQLLTVATIALLIAVLTSWIIAGRISKPIDKMSAVAEKWANGDKTATFEGGGYMEMDKLANTLNYAKSEIVKTETLQRDLMANVSHDLKTPLTMIKAYAEMIQDISGDNKEKRDKHTKVIIDEADRLTLLVNDILNLSKLQSSVEHVEKEKFDLSKMINGVIYKFENFVQLDGYKIITDIDNGVEIFADQSKIEEVIYNLIANSINYTGEDKVVKVYLKNKGEYALFEVLDSGLGMNQEQADTIWEKYYRASSTHKRAVKGTGLGLSIVKAILSAHDFDFGVISKAQVGSNFYIKFEIDKNTTNGGNVNE